MSFGGLGYETRKGLFDRHFAFTRANQCLGFATQCPVYSVCASSQKPSIDVHKLNRVIITLNSGDDIEELSEEGLQNVLMVEGVGQAIKASVIGHRGVSNVCKPWANDISETTEDPTPIKTFTQIDEGANIGCGVGPSKSQLTWVILLTPERE